MDSFLQGKTDAGNIHIKRFGYLLSAVFLIITSIGLLAKWTITPWLFLFTMYLLTGCLWIPVLIKPFYLLLGKYIIKPEENNPNKEELPFSKN